MLPTILVDPSALWLVHDGDTIEDAEEAIGRALQWMTPSAVGPLQLYLSARGVDALASANAFPAEPRFAEMLKLVGLEGVLSAKMLAASVSRFLSTNPWIEEAVGLQDVLFQKIHIAPDLTAMISDAELQTMSLEALGLAAVCASEDERHSLYAFPRQKAPHDSVRVETTIDILELGEGHARTEEDVLRNIGVLGDPSAWPKGLSAEHVWRSADNADELEVAIWLAANALDEQANCGVREFRVGTEFMDCLRANGASGDGPYTSSVLSKCAQTVLLQSNLQPSPFYSSTDANAPIRERRRDNAKAWRLHVTKRHQALRLMYWELPNGDIEFATLEAKNEVSIHDGEELPLRGW